MILHLIAIAVICVVVIDLSGFADTMAKAVSRFVRKTVNVGQLKPLTCSFCMTFWVSVIYLMASHQFTLMGLMYAVLAAFLTPAVNTLLVSVRDLAIALIHCIDILTDKITRL